ncbi:hypothetical protein EV646_107139 [Kribbella antiqua]|uniref:Uncharacterized protein n=1 Tax=Kribbella antiqua TaxID=2512217 RepID=A0A4R2IQ48_9ACTN|nr:hypothetical protein [Kribbella antiqua]TCO46118.1 hypothetical protein EV646_107139 [Kribbella antiqua]
MTLTDYAGLAGLFAAAVLALWMLLGAPDLTHTAPTHLARHRGTPTLRLPKPTHPVRATRTSK